MFGWRCSTGGGRKRQLRWPTASTLAGGEEKRERGRERVISTIRVHKTKVYLSFNKTKENLLTKLATGFCVQGLFLNEKGFVKTIQRKAIKLKDHSCNLFYILMNWL